MKLYDDWDAKRGRGEAAGPALGGSRAGPTATTAYGRRALDSELATLALATQGSRNATLNEVTFTIFQLVPTHIDADEAQTSIAEVARRIGLTPSEIMKTMGSARGAASRKPRAAVPEPTTPSDTQLVADVRWTPDDILTEPGPDSGALEPVPNPWDDLYVPRSALGSLPRGEPLIEGVLDRHTYFAVVGRDQSFKSFLVLDWLLCLATGKRWLGHDTVRTRALYVVGEGAYGLDDRVTSWEVTHNQGKPVEDEWFGVRRAPINLFQGEAPFYDLLDRIEREGWGIVIFDTLQRMGVGAEQNSAKDAAMIIASLDRVRHVADGSVGVVAHSTKDDRDLRGSSAFEDDADIVWRVKYDRDENRVAATLDKRKDGPSGLTYELTPTAVPGTPSLVLQRGSVTAHQPRPLPPNALKILLALGEPIFVDSGATYSRLRDHIGIKDGSISPALSRLMADGLLKKEGLSKGAIYKINSEGLKALSRLQEHKA